MHHFAYRRGVSHQNVLHAEEVDLADLAAAVGTPFYCYSSATLERHYRVFADAFAGAPDTLVCYSVKANSNLGVLATLARLGAGMDVVSEGELRRALAVGVPPERIVFSGVGKTARRDGLRARRRHLRASTSNRSPSSSAERGRREPRARPRRIAIRVNPDVDAKTHAKIATGKAENKFGVPFARARDALRAGAASCPASSVAGVHMHIGSQITDLAPFEDAFALLARAGRATLRGRRARHRASSISAAASASPIATTTSRRRSPADYARWSRRHVGDLGVQARVRARPADRRQCRHPRRRA